MFDDYFKYSSIFVNIFYYITCVLVLFHVVYYSVNRSLFSIENYFILMTFIIPLLFMVPFAYSDLNIYASWDFFRYRPLIDQSVFISCFGIISFILGTFISRLDIFYYIGIPKIVKLGVKEFWFGFTNKYIRNAIFLLIFLLFTYSVVSLGVGFGGGRSFAMDNPAIRPIFNFFSVIIAFFILYFYSYALYVNRKSLYILGLLLFICALGLGTRSLVLQPLVCLFFLKSFVDNKKVTLKMFLKTFLIAFICIYLAIIISKFRSSGSDNTSFILSFLYGNNFSDLRDFAWVMYGWNGDFLLGKTELAGLLSFIPSFISDFRQTWSWGVFSTSVVGLNSENHPGLRPGYFGESYINFGYVGVFLSGFLSGFLIHKYDTLIYNYRTYGSKQDVFKFYTFGFVYLSWIGNFCITSGFFSIYVMLSLIFIFYILRVLLSKKV